MSASGYEDGLGRRTLEFDRETGGMLERLHLRPELRAFEGFLMDRVARAAVFDDERFSRVRGIERDSRYGLTVLSQFVPGHRLCDLLEAATNLPADEATSPSVDAALGFLLEILPALGSLHTIAHHPHGTLAPGRIVLTHEGRVIVLDSIFGQPIERLQFNRARLWLELGLAAPAADGPVRLDMAADLAQASLVAMMIVIGRPLRDNEYPDGIGTLLTEVIEIAQIRGGNRFASGLQAFLARTLPLSTQHPYESAEEAAAEVRHVAKELGASRCRAALTSFVSDMNRVLASTRDDAGSAAASEDPGFAAGREDPDPRTERDEPSIDDLLAQIPSSTEAFLEAESLSRSPLESPTAELEAVAAAFDSAIAEADVPAALPESEAPPAPSESLHRSTIAPEPIRDADVSAPAPVTEPRALENAPVPVPVVVEAAPEPEPVEEPEPLALREEPEPAARPAPAAAVREPEVLRAAPPPAPAADEPEPVAEPAVAARRQEPAPRSSKRKRRGSKPHRDKLRSNAAPKPIQPPPAVPMPVPLGAVPATPQFGRIGEPLRQEASKPIQFAPAPDVRPPAPPKPPAPLRLKTEAPSGFSPGPQRAERREPHDAAAIPYVQRPEPAEAGGFPWRIAAAALVVIAVGIGAGRAYLWGDSKADPEKAETAAPVAAVKPAESSKVGTLALTTQPAGARVLLDGKSIGETPLTMADLAPGKHALTIVGSSGSVKKVIRIEAGKTLTLEIPIYSGWIAVFAPVPLDIAENGKAIGTTDQGRLMLSPGLHQLTLSNRQLAYKTVQIVDIEPGEERSINVQPTGALNANAEPWAEVWMAGKKIGETPIAGLQVPLGTHEILFKNPQYPDKRVTITVTGSGTAIAAVDFTR